MYLTRKPIKPLFHKGGNGPNSRMTGDCTGLWGDCTGLRGDLDKIPLGEREAKPSITQWEKDDPGTRAASLSAALRRLLAPDPILKDLVFKTKEEPYE